MFWKRSTAHGAFFGLLGGMAAAAATHGLTVAEGKGGWLTPLTTYPSTMAQNFWVAIWAFAACFLITVAVSLVTKAKPVAELKGLVWGVTPIPREENIPWWKKPVFVGALALAAALVMNWIFR
jgi:SSS family solute:Na+ symporter